MKTTVSFDFEGSYPEVIAQIRELLGKLDPPAFVAEPAKIRAPRPKRVLTEAARQAIPERFASGKAKAALARVEAVAPCAICFGLCPSHAANRRCHPTGGMLRLDDKMCIQA
jgi:hypothetical protein